MFIYLLGESNCGSITNRILCPKKVISEFSIVDSNKFTIIVAIFLYNLLSTTSGNQEIFVSGLSNIF